MTFDDRTMRAFDGTDRDGENRGRRRSLARVQARQCSDLVDPNDMSHLTHLLPAILAWLSMCTAMPAIADEDGRSLFDFSKPNAAQAWQPVNDGVMGGVSDGRFKITDQGTMEFFGTLSLENNGGFASVRSRRSNLGLKPDDTLLIRLRGDGREYLLNLDVPSLQIAYSYRASIPTKAGPFKLEIAWVKAVPTGSPKN
jgi:complex I intermediate-associated protein 30 (CIA30)